MGSSNPFIDRSRVEPEAAPVEDAIENDVVLGSRISTTGPRHPLAVRDGVDAAGALPISPLQATAPILVAGTHGGAGATTLVQLLGEGAADTYRTWPAPNPWLNGPPTGGVLLCARTHARGIDSARAVLSAWHAGAYATGLPLLGICLTDDAPRLSKGQIGEIKRLTAMAPHGWHLPWQEPFRHELEPSSPPGRVSRMLRSIRTHADRLGRTKE